MVQLWVASGSVAFFARSNQAGLRAFFPSFPLTQRHAVCLHNLEADLRPHRTG